MAAPDSRNGNRFLSQQIIHYRQIVRREVPDDVYVVLKKAQVDADRIEIVNIAEAAGCYQLLHFADGTGVDKGMIDKNL